MEMVCTPAVLRDTPQVQQGCKASKDPIQFNESSFKSCNKFKQLHDCVTQEHLLRNFIPPGFQSSPKSSTAVLEKRMDPNS